MQQSLTFIRIKNIFYTLPNVLGFELKTKLINLSIIFSINPKENKISQKSFE